MHSNLNIDEIIKKYTRIDSNTNNDFYKESSVFPEVYNTNI